MFGISKIRIIAGLATLLTLLGASTAMAQGTGWVTINPGQQQWYTFASGQASADATDAAILIQLTSVPQNSVSFAVWTQDELTAFNSGDTTFGRPVGDGTLHPFGTDNTRDYFGGDLAWVGRSLVSTTYHVQVSSKASTPVTYMLKIVGNYVSFPSGAPSVQAVSMGSGAASGALTAPLTLPSTGQSAVPSAGVSPSNPLLLTGRQRTLGVGQQEWYSFQYPGHDSNDNQPQANIVLVANPQGSATFSVWTKEELQALANGDSTFGVPVGRGTLHPATDSNNTTFDRFGGNLEWAGQSAAADTYYVQVEQTGSGPSTYSLQFTLQ
jgi:hypothetical protein